jgi:phospholipid/cholesterol/gamma-HCH transport system ATP-binding protein
MLHEFDRDTQQAIRASLPEDLLAQADAGAFRPTRGAGGRHWAPDADARTGDGQVLDGHRDGGQQPAGATATTVLARGRGWWGKQ